MWTKPVRASKTVWGLVLVLVPLLNQLGVELELGALVRLWDLVNELYLVAVQLVWVILALYGRFTVKKSLRL